MTTVSGQMVVGTSTKIEFIDTCKKIVENQSVKIWRPRHFFKRSRNFAD